MTAPGLKTSLLAAAVLALAASAPAPAATVHPPGVATPRFDQPIPNIPGKSLIATEIDYPPGGASSGHHHSPSAFIFAYVVSGAIRSQVDDGPVRVYHAGESFSERPGAHHAVSENASDTEPAKLLAVFVVDTTDKPLTIPDKR